MVETPLSKVARLLGGVALMQGRLGHQVLGQMLIAGTGELGVAGAAIAVAATERVRNPAAQVAIRTAAPAIALTALFERREQLLLHRERALLRRARDIGTSDFALETQNGVLKRKSVRLAAANAELQARTDLLNKEFELFRNYVRQFIATIEFERLEKSTLKSSNETLQKEKAHLQTKTDDLTEEGKLLRKVGRDLDLALKFERSERSVLKSSNEKLQQTNTDLQTEVAALHQKSALAEQVHHELEQALKHLHVERSSLKTDKARCVVEKYILQRRNNDLREEIKALKTAMGANEATAPADADEAPPDISRPRRKRAKRQTKKREQ